MIKIFNYLKKLGTKEGFRNYTLFKLILDTGLRLSEALNLKFRDVDFGTRTIEVKITKTNNERYVFFTKETASNLKKLNSFSDSQYLFINFNNNKRLQVNNIQSICTRLKKVLELPYAPTPHKWRHTFATNFLKGGGDLEALRLILGHSNLKTTQLYLHLDKEFLHKAYFKIYRN